MNKGMQKMLGIGLALIVLVGVMIIGGVGYNEDPTFTVIQPRIGGDPTVKGDNGMYFKWFGETDVYPDKDIIYFSKDSREGSSEDESIPTLFTDKGMGWWSFQITVRNPDTASDQVDFHRMVKGDYGNYRNAINARLKDAGRKYAESKTASEAAEKQSEFKNFVENALMTDKILAEEFHSKVIAVELTGVEFDDMTKSLFATQQQSLLLKKQAQIDAEKFEQQTLSTKADYAQQIEAEKGKADMIAMKATTDAEREAKLATIEAQRKVDVAELAKAEAEQVRLKMSIDANAQLEVATIALQEADARANAVIVTAKGEQERIKLAGAITEKDKFMLTVNKERDIGVAGAWANGNRLTPDFIIGDVGGEGGSLNDTLFSMKLIESLGLLSTNSVSLK